MLDQLRVSKGVRIMAGVRRAALTGITIREFARRDGCSPTLVRKALTAGRLIAFADRSLDPALVGTDWRWTNRRRADAADIGANMSAAVFARSLVDRTKADDADLVAFVAQGLAGRYASLAEAERVKANALALRHVLEVQREAAALVDREVAEAIMLEEHEAAREAWMNWPVRVAPAMAAVLGIDPGRLVEALAVHVGQQIADLGEPDPASLHGA